MLTLNFKVNANPPVPQGPEVTRVRQGELPDDEIDFDEENRVVVTGTGLALGDGDSIKLQLCPDKGAAIATMTSFKNIESSDTELSFLNDRNSSGKPDGDWWGQDALLTVTVGGVSATRWLKFHDWSTAKGTTRERDGSKFSGVSTR